MKTNHHHSKLKTQPRPLFSCGFFRNCTQSTLSPTTPHSPPLPLSSSQQPPASPPLLSVPDHPSPPPPPPPPPKNSMQKRPESSSSSSSSSASHSFTQWKFPIPTSPLHQKPTQATHFQPPPPLSSANLQELFHIAEVQFSTGSLSEQLAALQLLERSLLPNPPSDPVCSPELMRGIVSNLKNKAGVKPATKILLALCLAEGNRHIAVEAGAVGAVVEVAMELEGAAAERALAALELMCTVAEGAAEVTAHALAVPVMVSVMGRLAGRGREYAISVISVIYGGGCGGGNGDDQEEDMVPAPPEEVARAVALALQGECTARGRRKGAQLLKTLEEYGRLNLTQDGNEGF
ncbi:Catalytics isoform 1 [Hibiscus syriacus]|uniref:Catalytics isoform 1 n=1 Tax=Hibiscus syriacus TaxID=106335 RepID=A0A6A2Z982_HIBSY|nr:E3 ubiquitin-protein ligase PUB23-like [Hibiscus syriacus]KAE8687632.1 Catalytics isoform 1 [Hibiscus syriacus]